ncbi:metal-dependent hydrolase [Massilia sp. NR 4-1]|uniref:metal-dependent hydrolase n=1 Tax=Massilia sp. NR 4-1 TaxID=1678028 RepID=UPI00067B7305|nr:metal-dependent hydrolase [Massilia sp. NR 4-1]AKU23980.1 hypothetical protein ACZ75_23475 [Massilia sp. NR 4-1]
MDNITHSLVGLGVGELLQRSLPAEASEARQRTRHRLLLTACAAASNFPDLDLFLTKLMAPPLGYLLQHRGHTHTLLFLLPQALLLLAVLWLLWPNARALLRESRVARFGLLGAMTAGFLLHLGMDFMNSYGVHPFYPFNADWYFGDMIFIVEPVFWVAFGVPLALAIPWRPVRWLMVAVLAVALLYFTLHGYLGWASYAGLLLLGGAIAALRLLHLRSRRALALALVLCLGFIGVQKSASSLARERVAAALHKQDGAAQLLDVALTAFPAQPLCWSFAAIERNEARDSYRVRRGMLSLAPAWLPPAQCPASMLDPAPPRTVQAGVLLHSEWNGSLSLLRRLRESDCQLDAWLRFARIPAVDSGHASDLRFTSTPRGNFTTMDVASGAPRACPAHIPRWGQPRSDLLTRP